MPRVYRLMKVENGLPKVADASMCLKTRAGEIPVDPSGNVHPATGGLSVYDAMRTIPAEMLPKRLKPRIPGAAGSNSLFVFAMGTGSFESGTLSDQLDLRIDPEDSHHGFIEPHAIMSLSDYHAVLVSTLSAWKVDEA